MSERWVTSGPGRPCPLCGRNTSDQCRRRAGEIHCWFGSSFSPPPGLRLGDVVTIEGSPWAVVNLAGGFGHNSLVLRPHREQQRGQRRQSARTRRLAAIAGSRAWIAATAARGALHDALGAMEVEHSDLEQFTADLHAAQAAVTLIDNAMGRTLVAMREGHQPPVPMHALTLWARLARYQLADLAMWDRWALGTPTPAEVCGLMANNLKAQEVAA